MEFMNKNTARKTRCTPIKEISAPAAEVYLNSRFDGRTAHIHLRSHLLELCYAVYIQIDAYTSWLTSSASDEWQRLQQTREHRLTNNYAQSSSKCRHLFRKKDVPHESIRGNTSRRYSKTELRLSTCIPATHAWHSIG